MIRRAVFIVLAGICLLAGVTAAVVNNSWSAAADGCARCHAEHNACRTRQRSLDSSKCDVQLIKCLRTCKRR